MAQVVIAFGANLGDRAHTILAASAAIGQLESTSLLRLSSLYQSAALKPGGIDLTAPEYVNAVGLYETELSAEELLTHLAELEHEFGRERHERWGDRTLDLDIIWMEDVLLESEHLTIPHPRAGQRSFVVVPWLEIQPEAVLAGQQLSLLAQQLEDEVTVFDAHSQVRS